jgi:hypothetical protein
MKIKAGMKRLPKKEKSGSDRFFAEFYQIIKEEYQYSSNFSTT